MIATARGLDSQILLDQITVGENEPTGDEKFFSLSRQPKCIPIISTQSISSLKSALPAETWRTLLQTFRTKIFLALSDDYSAKIASELCGKEDQIKVGYNLSETGHDANISFLTGKAQSNRTTTSEGVTTIVAKAKGQYQMLYALLAGCGPLRAGEALGLEIDKHIFPDCRTLNIIQKAKRGDIQQHLKTKHGKRYVDLCAPLAAMLRDFIGRRTSGLLFQTSTGAQLLQANTLQDSLHPILKSMKHVQGGFNIFRRYRLSYIDKSDCPEALRHFWSGHAPRHVSERYIKLMNDRQYRLDWAERLGTGFQIPGSVGLPGLLRVVPKIA